MRASILLSSLALALTSLSAHIRITVPVSNALPNPGALPPSTSASLTTLGNTYTAPLDTSNTFAFRNVSAGSYLLDVNCATHFFFAPLRIDVEADDSVEAWGTYRGNEWTNKGEIIEIAEGDRGEKILQIKAAAMKNYLQERAGFSPLSILKNPMILLAGVALLLMVGMPKLMENMDPETRAEFEERQKSSPMNAILSGQQSQAPLGNFDPAAWLAGAPAKPAGGAAASQEKGVTR